MESSSNRDSILSISDLLCRKKTNTGFRKVLEYSMWNSIEINIMLESMRNRDSFISLLDL